MYAWARGFFESLAGAQDILLDCAAERGDGRLPALCGHRLDGHEITFGSDRESRLDDINSKSL